MIKFWQQKKSNTWLPFFMPWVWHIVLVAVALMGFVAGVILAIYTLMLRGLM